MSDTSNGRVIISGINGFVGHHLAHSFRSKGYEIVGIGRDDALDPTITNEVSQYIQADLAQEWPEIADTQIVIHLAGLAAVGPSFDAPQLYIDTNSAMVTNLCEFYVKQERKPRIVIISSGAIYNNDQPMPLSEASAIGFSSPYAVSKVLTENQAEYYKNRGLDCVVARPFNHIGPGQGPNFLLPDLYDQLVQAKESNQDTISVGNLTTRRDYTDVRDIVEAYVLLGTATKLAHPIYNVASGRSFSGLEIFDYLKKAMHLDTVEAVIDQSKVRPTDAPDIVGDSTRLQSELGWKPSYTIDQTINDFVASKAR